VAVIRRRGLYSGVPWECDERWRPLRLALRSGGSESHSQENNGEKSFCCEVRDGQFRAKSMHGIPPLAYSPGRCVQSGILERGGWLFLTQQGARTQNEQGETAKNLEGLSAGHDAESPSKIRGFQDAGGHWPDYDRRSGGIYWPEVQVSNRDVFRVRGAGKISTRGG